MVRVATYNVENLFSRPTLFNWTDKDKAAVYLQKINELSKLLDKKSYAADRARIEKLYADVKPYIDINIRSSEVGRYLFVKKKPAPTSASTPKERLVPKGRGEWDGFIDLKRERFSSDQVKFTAKVINTVEADIQCFVEVESAPTLQMFNTDRLQSAFSDRIVIDGNDQRGIDVALATRKGFPIETARTNVFARDEIGTIFSRDCLEVEIALPGGKSLYVLVNHFKAKDRNEAESNEKRRRQAAEVSRILTTRYNLKKDYVIVAGDLNDEPASAPLKELFATPDLHSVLDIVNWPANDRWTYYYETDDVFNVIDHMLVSSALKPKVKQAGLERRGIYNLAKLTNGAASSFPGITSFKLAGSDHAALWADFDL